MPVFYVYGNKRNCIVYIVGMIYSKWSYLNLTYLENKLYGTDNTRMICKLTTTKITIFIFYENYLERSHDNYG